MRLLNATNYDTKEFHTDIIPPYAILSHRWENEEVTFQDLCGGRGPTRAGYSKIKGCCAQALRDGWEWVWVDSCCIDKISSSELSEAINSMFKWYSDAKVCYVYLSDVPSGDSQRHEWRSSFCFSKWFSRGWTLQELLAPKAVIFFDQGWADLGSRNSLRKLLFEVTVIDDFADFKSASVARKMSWAAKRQTTRPEDTAYCLMGLFDIHMPILYGEGAKAFMRLQREILNTSDDESIFAWTSGQSQLGLLATSPSAFADCGDIEFKQIPGFLRDERPPYLMTSKGLRMEHIIRPAAKVDDATHLSLLNCKLRSESGNLAITLYINKESQTAFRFNNSTVSVNEPSWKNKFIKKALYIQQFDPHKVDHISPEGMLVKFGDMISHGFVVTERWVRKGLGYPDFIRQDQSTILSHSVLEHSYDKEQYLLKSDRIAIGFQNETLGIEFMVFLAPSASSSAHIEFLPLHPNRIMEILNWLSGLTSSDRVSKSIAEDTVASVSIRPGLYQRKHIQIAEITITEGPITWPQPAAVTGNVQYKFNIETSTFTSNNGHLNAPMVKVSMENEI